ncbi:MAG: hypothetical protein JWL63_3558 [Rhodocyclales bacterium]|nr:hypothetical protein [Rhodocyclales bacterium]
MPTVAKEIIVITFEQIQRATARCLEAHPAIDSVLPKESRLLVELLGRMIYARSDSIDERALSSPVIEDLRHWGAR